MMNGKQNGHLKDKNMKQQANNPEPVTCYTDSVISIQKGHQEATKHINSTVHSLTWHQPCNNQTEDVPLESHWI